MRNVLSFLTLTFVFLLGTLGTASPSQAANLPVIDIFDGWCTCPDGSIYVCMPGMTYYIDPCYFSGGYGANPYEYLGEAHNLGMQWVGEHLDTFLTLDPGYQLTAIASALGDHACSGLEGSPAEVQACRASVSAGVMEGYELGQMSDADYVAHVAVSAAQGDALTDVLALLRQGEHMPFEQFLTEMKALEQAIMASGMSEGEQAAPLMVAAVARHSAFFWLSAAQNGDDPWQSHLQAQGRSGDDFELFAADAKGALTGGITGALIGGVPTGGIGAVPGAFLGALGGLWGGTIGEALF